MSKSINNRLNTVEINKRSIFLLFVSDKIIVHTIKTIDKITNL